MKLKPCPFCTSIDLGLYIFNNYGGITIYDGELYERELYEREQLRVYCEHCDAKGPAGEGTVKGAFRAWNRRTEPVVSKMQSTEILKGVDSEDCPAEFNRIFQDNFKDILA